MLGGAWRCMVVHVWLVVVHGCAQSWWVAVYGGVRGCVGAWWCVFVWWVCRCMMAVAGVFDVASGLCGVLVLVVGGVGVLVGCWCCHGGCMMALGVAVIRVGA